MLGANSLIPELGADSLYQFARPKVDSGLRDRVFIESEENISRAKHAGGGGVYAQEVRAMCTAAVCCSINSAAQF